MNQRDYYKQKINKILPEFPDYIKNKIFHFLFLINDYLFDLFCFILIFSI